MVTPKKRNEARSDDGGFDARAPLRGAHTPPASWYVDPNHARIEDRRVFRRNWLHVAHDDEAPASTGVVPGVAGSLPFILTRDEGGALRAFANVCRHRAAILCERAANSTEVSCPYHGWSYALDGRLVRAPDLGAVADFDRDAHGLHEFRLAGVGPLLFIHADPAAADPALGAWRQPLAELFDVPLVRRERRRYDLACNWKVFVDNYLDGGYHVARVHPALAGELDLDDYATTTGEDWVLQTARAHATSARLGSRARYLWVYPNLMLNRYGDVLDVNVVHPVGPDRCEVVFDWYFPPNTGGGDVARAVAASEQVHREDMDICESVQRGLASGYWARGRYAVAVEKGEHVFHRRLAADLGAER